MQNKTMLKNFSIEPERVILVSEDDGISYEKFQYCKILFKTLKLKIVKEHQAPLFLFITLQLGV